MPLLEELYSRRCRPLIGCYEIGEATLRGPNSVRKAMKKVQLNRERLKTTHSHRRFDANV